ncbi:MAG: hypothetical protein IJ081_07485 [Prevotella sp.]|nr:hypothetical protein [Prevotella sp.]
MKKIISILGVAALIWVLSSCRKEDDFTESIFNTNIAVVDTASATAPFDKWLYDNFLVPYNVEVQYRFNFPASDKNFLLTPAEYGRSQLLAHFIRYLFYDVYTKYAGDNFMKQYGPRIFHFIGSTGYSPTTGTEVLGTAAGGVKITLYNVNEIKPWSPTVVYSADDVELLNERIFHTMHHEFSHILHQTKSYPVTFGQVTSGSYDPINWQERDSTTTHQLGYLTHYASSATYEDFVETLSCAITDTDQRWMNRIINACLTGLRAGDKERVLTLVDSLGIDPNEAGAHWNNFSVYKESQCDETTGEYIETGRYVLDNFRSSETVYVMVNGNWKSFAKYKYTDKKDFTSFKNGFMPWVSITTNETVAGINAILKKIDIATEWYTDRWGLHVFKLREEVRNRQNAINTYLKSDDVVIYDL